MTNAKSARDALLQDINLRNQKGLTVSPEMTSNAQKAQNALDNILGNTNQDRIDENTTGTVTNSGAEISTDTIRFVNRNGYYAGLLANQNTTNTQKVGIYENLIKEAYGDSTLSAEQKSQIVSELSRAQASFE